MAQSKITFFTGKKRPLRESQDDCDGVPKKTSTAENKSNSGAPIVFIGQGRFSEARAQSLLFSNKQ